MPTGLKLLSPPQSEPVDVKEARIFARVDTADDDPLLRSFIIAARSYCENIMGMQFVSATWQLTVDRFPRYSQLGGLQYASEALWNQRIPQTELAGRYWPDRASFRLPKPPLLGVSQIQYLDGATGNLLILDPSTYLVDNSTRPGRIAPVPGGIWPIIKQQLGSVVITYTAGYGDPKDVPEPIKLAIKMLVAHWYEHREAVGDYRAESMPVGVDALLASEWSGEWY